MLKPSMLYASLATIFVCSSTSVSQVLLAGFAEAHDTQPFDGGQLTRITISAWFAPDVGDLFASTTFDMVVSESLVFDPLVEHEPERLIYEPPGTYRNIKLLQFHIPTFGIFGDESNPLPICELEFFTRDLSPRDLIVEIPLIYRFNLYEDASSADVIELQPDQYPNRVRWTIPVGIPCRADFDADGSLTIFDFLAYQNAFSAGDPIADFDGDGELTIFDFLAFQNEFDAGCE